MRYVDRGWTAEIAFPWQGMEHLANGRHLPPKDGDIWRLDVSRFQHIRTGDFSTCPGWVWSCHNAYDSHNPDRFTYMHMSEAAVSAHGATSHE